MPHSHVFAIELGRQATAKITVIQKEHNTWQLQSPRHLRLRNVNKISELSVLLEAARREATQGLPFVDDALLANQKLIEIWARRQVVDAPLQTKLKANVRLIAQFF